MRMFLSFWYLWSFLFSISNTRCMHSETMQNKLQGQCRTENAILHNAILSSRTGEFRRSYSPIEVKKVINRYQFAFSMGINIGPGLNIVLHKITFNIGWWHINENNAPALFIAILSAILLVACFFGVENSSKDYERMNSSKIISEVNGENSGDSLKRNQINSRFDNNIKSSNNKKFNNDNNDNNNNSNNNNNNSNSSHITNCTDNNRGHNKTRTEVNKMLTWKNLFQTDLLILCISTGIVRYVNSVGYLLISLLALHKFNWSLTTVSSIFLIFTTICFFLIFLLSEWNLIQGRLRSFFIYIMSMVVAMIVLILLLLVIVVFDISSFTTQYLCVVVLVILMLTMHFFVMANGKLLMVRIIPECHASLADGFRNAWCSGLRSLAYFTISLTYAYPQYIFPELVIILFFCSLFMLSRRTVYI